MEVTIKDDKKEKHQGFNAEALLARDNPSYLQGFIDGHGIQEPISESDFPHGFKNINEIYDRLYELRPPKRQETAFTLEEINTGPMVKATGPGWFNFLEGNHPTETSESMIDKFRDFIKEYWNDNSLRSKPQNDNELILRVSYGWSSSDENDPNRYIVEAYEIGGKMQVITGRGGMENLLKEGYIPLKVIFNGKPMAVDIWLKEFKRITNDE